MVAEDTYSTGGQFQEVMSVLDTLAQSNGHWHSFIDEGQPRRRRFSRGQPYIIVEQLQKCSCGAVRTHAEMEPWRDPRQVVAPAVLPVHLPSHRLQVAAITHRFGRTVRPHRSTPL